jgi:uncharacterized protein YjiS (DUF1127 family)
MPQVWTATVKSIYSKALSWFRTGANLVELNALDSRTLKDIGLNRNEFHTAADPITPFERGVTLHEAPTQCVSLRKSSCLYTSTSRASFKDRLARGTHQITETPGIETAHWEL